jgi:predicted hydrolase (HD superfamily)
MYKKYNTDPFHILRLHGLTVEGVLRWYANEIEKRLFTIDELTGLLWAAAKMRP